MKQNDDNLRKKETKIFQHETFRHFRKNDETLLKLFFVKYPSS